MLIVAFIHAAILYWLASVNNSSFWDKIYDYTTSSVLRFFHPKKGVTQYFEKIYDNCRVFDVVHHIRPSLVVLSKEKSFSITHVHATLVYLDVSILLQGFVIRDTDQFRLGLSHLLISLITLHRTNSFSFGFENHGSFGRSYWKSPASAAGIYVLNFWLSKFTLEVIHPFIFKCFKAIKRTAINAQISICVCCAQPRRELIAKSNR